MNVKIEGALKSEAESCVSSMFSTAIIGKEMEPQILLNIITLYSRKKRILIIQ